MCIILKKGGPLSEKAQEYLAKFGIDPYFGKECLVWAPLRGHTNDAQERSAKAIIDFVEANTSLSDAKMRKNLIEILKVQAKHFIEGT